MRINIYSQELDLERSPEMVQKTGTNVDGETETFYGVRFFLISPSVIHQTKEDDDQSAITFWLPQSVNNRGKLVANFDRMAEIIEENTEFGDPFPSGE